MARKSNREHTKGVGFPKWNRAPRESQLCWTITRSHLSSESVAKRRVRQRPTTTEGLVSWSGMPDHVGDLRPLFGRQAHKLEPGTHGGSVAHDGHSGDDCITQLEINGYSFPQVNFPLHDSSEAALSQIEANPVRASYTAMAQMMERDWDAEQNSRMVPEDFMRTVRLDSRVNTDWHG